MSQLLLVLQHFSSAVSSLPDSVLLHHDCQPAAAQLAACVDDLVSSSMPLAARGSHLRQQVLPLATRLAPVLQDWWSSREQRKEAALRLAQAAARRSCAYLRCANLGGEGGPAAKQGVGSSRCRCELGRTFCWEVQRKHLGTRMVHLTVA